MRPPLINTHCHLLCFEFIPDIFMSDAIEDRAHISLPEFIARTSFAGKISKVMSKRGSEFLGAFAQDVKCDDCFNNFNDSDLAPSLDCKNCFGHVVRNFICDFGEYLTDKMVQDKGLTSDNKQFDIYVPLMMDMEWGANTNDKGLRKYIDQITFISEQVKRFPFRIFPFVMFDPRRGKENCNSADYNCYKDCMNSECGYKMCVDALENKGFLGIKMYPPMGYFPKPVNQTCLHSASNAFEQTKRDVLRKMVIGDESETILSIMDTRLERMYEYCERNAVPITTHSGASGAYDIDMDQGQANIFANIDNWQSVLEKHPKLRLNLAHMGGNYIECDGSPVKNQAKIWRKKVINLLKTYENTYADIAYHDMGLESSSFGSGDYHSDQVEVEKYFFDLHLLMQDEQISAKVLFGTDTPMLSHTWSEKDYYDQFTRNMSKEGFKKIATTNPIKFLFNENGEIPSRYINFINKYNPSQLSRDNLSEWAGKTGGEDYHESDRYFVQL